jgi:hypothetical protein
MIDKILFLIAVLWVMFVTNAIFVLSGGEL